MLRVEDLSDAEGVIEAIAGQRLHQFFDGIAGFIVGEFGALQVDLPIRATGFPIDGCLRRRR